MGKSQGDQRGYFADVRFNFTTQEAEVIADIIVDAIFPKEEKKESALYPMDGWY